MIYRFLRWLFGFPPPPASETLLCQCGHAKCFHVFGSGTCWHESPPESKLKLCACACFVPVPPPVSQESAELDELRKMAGLKNEEPRR